MFQQVRTVLECVRGSLCRYPLEDINKVLGDSKDICSILEASLDEEIYLMSHIWDRDFCGDNEDVVADGIMAHLSAGKKVFWEESYNQDVAARAEEKAVPEQNSVPDEADPLTPPPCDTPSPGEMWEMMKTMMEDGFKSMLSWQEMVEVRLGMLEDEVKTLKKNNKGKERVEDDEDDESEYHSVSLQRENEYFGFGEGTSGRRREDENFGVGEAAHPSTSEPSPVAAAHPSPVAAAHPSPVAAAHPSPVAAAYPSPIFASEPSQVPPSQNSPVRASQTPPVPVSPTSSVPVPVTVPCLPSAVSKKRKTRSSKYMNTPFMEWKKKKREVSKERSKEGNKKRKKKGSKKENKKQV